MFETMLLDVADGIATITLNRPEKANAINDQFKADLRGAMEVAEADPSCRVVLITGAGRHFCAGGDLSAPIAPFVDAFGVGTPVHYTAAIHHSRMPVIAAINGAVKGGGCELALACDFRIIARTARIGLPEVLFGGVPGSGGTQRLPRLVGIAAAKEMIFLGLDKTAEEALAIGLVDKVVEPENLIPAALALAHDLTLRPGYALAAAKRLINRGTEMPLDDALVWEREMQVSMATPEQRQAAQDAATTRSKTYARIFGGG